MSGKIMAQNPQALKGKLEILSAAIASTVDAAKVDMSLTTTHGGISQYSNQEFKNSQSAREDAVKSLSVVVNSLYDGLKVAAEAPAIVDNEIAAHLTEWRGDGANPLPGS